jgi:hypothetical protein
VISFAGTWVGWAGVLSNFSPILSSSRDAHGCTDLKGRRLQSTCDALCWQQEFCLFGNVFNFIGAVHRDLAS